MTPEELWTKIENSLNTTADLLAHHSEQLEAQRIHHDKEIGEIRELRNAMASGMIRLQETQELTARDLRESKKRWDEGMEDLRAVQRITEEKLHALIDTVDRIIRSRNR